MQANVLRDRCVLRCYLLVGLAYETLAEAVAAVRSALARHQEEAGLRILVLEPRNDGVIYFAARVPGSGTLQFFKRGFDDVLQLFVGAALADLGTVEGSDLVLGDAAFGRFVGGEDT